MELTPRETAIVGLVIQARSNESIGRELGMSVSTVRARLRTLYRRLDLHRFEDPRVALALKLY